MAISLTAWLGLALAIQPGGTPLCVVGSTGSHFPGALSNWILMIVAMMPPLVVLSVRHVGFRSFRDRRHFAIAEFLAGYLAIWIAAGFLLSLVLIGLDMVWRGTDGILAGLAYLAAVGWQLTPFKRRALWRCHRTVPLAVERRRADLACVWFGTQMGADCLTSCWLLMALLALRPHSLLAMACLQAAMVHERYQQSRRPRPAVSIALLCGAFLLTLLEMRVGGP